MKFNDILALAKNGYSPKDIKDLMSLADGNDEADEGVQEKKVDQTTEPIVQKDAEPKAADTEHELEYKNRLSELEQQNKNLQEQIKQLQKQNTNKPLPEKEDTTEHDLDDLFRSFM